MAKKYKKINWDKCDKKYKVLLHGCCINYCINRECEITKETCIAYAKWEKSDGTF